MKKTLFLRTESGIVVVPRLENCSWLGCWMHNRWLKSYFKTTVHKAAPKPWRILSSMFEVKVLVEKEGVFQVENEQ